MILQGLGNACPVEAAVQVAVDLVSIVFLGNTQVATCSLDYLNGGAVSIRYQHTDALGSPVAETDGSGAVIKRNAYAPYGSTSIDGAGYTGHVMDRDTGLTYMQQRYYDPVIGRFASTDPTSVDPYLADNFNRYFYASNAPFTYMDPDGRDENTLPGLTATATTTIFVRGTRSIPVPRMIPTIPWSEVLTRVVAASRWSVPITLLIYPTELGAQPCEMSGGPVCGAYSGKFPPGYMPGPVGAAEWGRRHGVNPKAAQDRFHRGVKGNTNGARADHDYGVNPDTGDVVDPNGESAGNLEDTDDSK